LPQQGSSEKRNRQNDTRRLQNKMVRSRVRTAILKFADQVHSGAKEDAGKSYLSCQSLLDRAVTKGVFHRNLAARKKERLFHLLQKMG